MPLRELRRLLDPGAASIRPFQVVIYAGYLAAGLHALATGVLPNAVGQVLGPVAHVGWIMQLIACPLLAFVGVAIVRRTPRGLWLLLAADSGIAAASALYVLALTQATYAGRASFALWVVAGLMVCAVAWAVRDIRTLRAVSAAARRLTE